MKSARFYTDALFYGGDRDGFISIMTRYTPVTDPAAYQHMSFSMIDLDGRVDLDSLSSLQEWYAAHGYIPKRADISASLDPSFATYALNVLGTYE